MEQNHGGYGLINKSISEAVLEAALRTGGDFSELYMQDTEFNTVKMVDGAVDNASYERKAGAGVRVLKGTRSAYAYTANTSESALIAAAKAAASALNEAKEFEAKSVCVERIGGYEQKYLFNHKNADRIALLRSGTAAAKAYSNEVTQVVAAYMDCDHRIAVCNSDGVYAEDRRPRTRLMIQSVAMANGEAQTGYEGPGFGKDSKLISKSTRKPSAKKLHVLR